VYRYCLFNFSWEVGLLLRDLGVCNESVER
jgi:hypothetical protein